MKPPTRTGQKLKESAGAGTVFIMNNTHQNWNNMMDNLRTSLQMDYPPNYPSENGIPSKLYIPIPMDDLFINFPSENLLLLICLWDYIPYKEKRAETTSQNQSWSSALDPCRRTSWVDALGAAFFKGGSMPCGINDGSSVKPLGQLGQQPRPTHFNTQRL